MCFFHMHLPHARSLPPTYMYMLTSVLHVSSKLNDTAMAFTAPPTPTGACKTYTTCAVVKTLRLTRLLARPFAFGEPLRQ